MGKIEIPCLPGDYIMGNWAQSPPVKIVSISVGLHLGIKLHISGRKYRPIKIDESLIIVTCRKYCRMSKAERFFVDWIVGEKSELLKIHAELEEYAEATGGSDRV